MYALQQFLIGLAFIHLAWAFFYLTGTLIRRPGAAESPAESVLSTVIASGCGIAVTGLATFVLGLAHLIRGRGFVVLIVLVIVAFLARRDSPFLAAFWRLRLRSLGNAARSPAIVVYAISLIDAVPATLPDRAFDSLFFYSVISFEYAKTHFLFVDNWLRDPYWTNNWSLVETWLYTFHYEEFLPFLTWLTGMLSMLGIFGAVALEIERLRPRTRLAVVCLYVVAFGAVGALLLNPMFLWLNSGGMIDVPCGFMMFVAGISCYLAIRCRSLDFIPPVVVSAALLIGAKESYIALLPFFFVAVWTIMRTLGSARRGIVMSLVALTLLSLPWYVSNFVQDGDPVPPLLNLALHHHDSKWSERDNEQQLQSLRRNRRSAVEIAKLPVDLFVNDDDNLVSIGQTAVVLLLMLPGAVLLFSVIGGTVALDTTVLSAVLLYAIAYWLLTSYHARYALLFYPLLCTFVGILLQRVTRRRPAWAPVVAVVALLFAVPTPSSAGWLAYFERTDIVAVSDYAGRDAYLKPRILGYPEALYLSAELNRTGQSAHHVYGFGVEMLKYPFIINGVTEVGDWFGPEGYGNLIDAVDRGTVVSFLRSLDVVALVVPADYRPLTARERASFGTQLLAAGFSASTCPGGDGVVMYLLKDPAPPACAP